MAEKRSRTMPHRQSVDEVHRLLEVVRLFYEADLSEKEIGQRLDVSSTHIGRLLNIARRQGLIRFQIVPPAFADLQERLRDRFSFLKEALVVPSSDDFVFERRLCAKVAAQYFDTKVRSGMRSVAVGGGNTLYDMVTELPVENRHLDIYPTAMIGRGPTIESPDRAVIMSLLWARSGGQTAKAYYASILPAENVSSVSELQEEHQRFLKRPIVKQVYTGMRKVQAVFTGLGPVGRNPDYDRLSPRSTLKRLSRLGVIPANLKSTGAVGEVSYDFFDDRGDTRPEWKLALSLGVDELKQIVSSGRDVVVIAGRHREEALKGALRGEILNVLITDDRTANDLLKIKSIT